MPQQPVEMPQQPMEMPQQPMEMAQAPAQNTVVDTPLMPQPEVASAPLNPLPDSVAEASQESSPKLTFNEPAPAPTEQPNMVIDSVQEPIHDINQVVA